jgi:sec-independent protein translocase protein TatA
MPSIGPLELVIVLVIIVVVFGIGKLPEVGGGLGKGIREFRRSLTGKDDDDDDAKGDSGSGSGSV